MHTRLLAIVRRSVADYGTWQLGHEKGIRFCSQLEAIKLRLLDRAGTATAVVDKDPSSMSVFSEELVAWHQRLQVVLEVFGDVVKNASEAVHQLRALERLSSTEDKDIIVIGRTWRFSRFVVVAEQLLNHYEMEYKVKEMVFRELCHRTSQSQVMSTALAWTYPRHVGQETRFLVKCMAVECGLPEVGGGGGGGVVE